MIHSRAMKLMVMVFALLGTFSISSCGSGSKTTRADACRVLNLARGASLDLSFASMRQDPKDLTKFLPLTKETINKYEEVIQSLNDLAIALGTGDKADLAKQYADDLGRQFSEAKQGLPSMESAAAISNDMTRVTALCGY